MRKIIAFNHSKSTQVEYVNCSEIIAGENLTVVMQAKEVKIESTRDSLNTISAPVVMRIDSNVVPRVYL